MMKSISFSTIDGGASFEDLTELAKIHLTKKGIQITEDTIEEEQENILNHMNNDMFILIKNKQEQGIGYCALDKGHAISFRIYSLFIDPTYRQQGVATKTLQHLADILGQDKEVYLEIYKQDEYNRLQRPINSEKLIKLVEKGGYSILEKGNKYRATLGPKATQPTDSNT